MMSNGVKEKGEQYGTNLREWTVISEVRQKREKVFKLEAADERLNTGSRDRSEKTAYAGTEDRMEK